jgi:FtsP/CotA-like multicopper oxidase with cupredoxin domain
MRAFVNERPNVFGDQPGYGMIVQEGKLEPARDSLTFPGAALVLQRGEPTEITVHNRTHQPVTIHWHGIELESFYDGVGDWSGWGNRTAPAIAPGDSFVVRLTPDRAGTFIYHTHNEEGAQLASGLYGSLLILPPGAQRDTTTDRVFLLGAGGPNPVAPPFVNGTATPAPVELRAGSTYRLRLINISPSDIKRVRLLGDGADSAVVQQWRAFAKDGAELPAHQATMRRAVVTIGPGETYDYELTRETPVTLSLEIRTAPRGPISFARLPVRVR